MRRVFPMLVLVAALLSSAGVVAQRRAAAGQWPKKTNFVASGIVSLRNAPIGGDILLNDAEFRDGGILNLRGATIGKGFRWETCNHAPVSYVHIDLVDASADTLAHNEACWPRVGHLTLDWFRYQRIDARFAASAPARLRWLARHRDAPPVVYRQLASVLGDSGDPDGAREVLIAMEFARRARESGVWAWIWNWTLALTIGYGYAPWRAAWPAFLVIALDAVIFSQAYRSGGITPSDKDAAKAFHPGVIPRSYPAFLAPMYALDSFLPIVNFGQKDHWRPNAHSGARWWGGRPAGWYARAYL
jgi:hypothetical protein